MPSLSSAIIFVYHHMKSIMEKDRPSSTLWRNNNSHIIENQCGLGIGGSMVKKALPVGSMLIAQFVKFVQFVITILNLQFLYFHIIENQCGLGIGETWLVKEAMGFKARWFTIVVCLTALHMPSGSLLIIIVIIIVSKFVTCARRVCKLLKQADDSSLFLVLSTHLKSRVIFVLETPLKCHEFYPNCEIFPSSSNSVNKKTQFDRFHHCQLVPRVFT